MISLVCLAPIFLADAGTSRERTFLQLGDHMDRGVLDVDHPAVLAEQKGGTKLENADEVKEGKTNNKKKKFEVRENCLEVQEIKLNAHPKNNPDCPDHNAEFVRNFECDAEPFDCKYDCTAYCMGCDKEVLSCKTYEVKKCSDGHLAVRRKIGSLIVPPLQCQGGEKLPDILDEIEWDEVKVANKCDDDGVQLVYANRGKWEDYYFIFLHASSYKGKHPLTKATISNGDKQQEFEFPTAKDWPQRSEQKPFPLRKLREGSERSVKDVQDKNYCTFPRHFKEGTHLDACILGKATTYRRKRHADNKSAWLSEYYQGTKQFEAIVGPFTKDEVHINMTYQLKFTVGNLELDLGHRIVQQATSYTSDVFSNGDGNRCELDELMQPTFGFDVKHDEETGRSRRPVIQRDNVHRTTHSLKSISYNVFGLSHFKASDSYGGHMMTRRVILISKYLKEEKPDFVVLSEAFHKWTRELFVELLPTNCKYFAESADAGKLYIFDGGILICSRYPIDQTRTKWVKFDAPHKAGLKSEAARGYMVYEKYADKGVLFAPIKITGNRVGANRTAVPFELTVNIFGTHLQSSSTELDNYDLSSVTSYDRFIPLREKQLLTIRELMDRVQLDDRKLGPKEKDVITTALGDFNVDKLADPRWAKNCSRKTYTPKEEDEYIRMLATLNMIDAGSHLGCDDATYSSKNSFSSAGAIPEHLDYQLFKEPLPYYVKGVTTSTGYPKAKRYIYDSIKDPSDHFPIVTLIQFKDSPTEN